METLEQALTTGVLRPEKANETLPLTDEQKRRRTSEALVAAARNGEITSMEGLDPRATSAETLRQVRALLQKLGHVARANGPDGL